MYLLTDCKYYPLLVSVATESVLSDGYMLVCADQVLRAKCNVHSIPYKHGGSFQNCKIVFTVSFRSVNRLYITLTVQSKSYDQLKNLVVLSTEL